MTPEEKGTQLMASMGVAVVATMSKPTMPPDSEIINALKKTAQAVEDYTEKAAQAVEQMANLLLNSIKEAIHKAISKSKPEIPTPTSIQDAIKKAIEEAAPKAE